MRRAGRYTLAIVLVMTGAVMARPDDVLPFAAKLAAPLMSKSEALPVTESPAPASPEAAELPDYVTTSHDLSMSSPGIKEAAPAAIDAGAVAVGEAATAALAPAPAQIAPLVPDDTAADGSGGPAAIEIPADTSGVANVAATAPAGAVPAPRPVIAAKTLFGAAKGPSLLQARAIGTYARGCLAGAVALPVDGPAWQAMRLSRNRNWGHPKLVDLVERLATTAQKNDDWPGLLVGDISQPRGGPMLTGHASHQLGLDADVWLTPMPDRRLSKKEREDLAATSMLDKTDLAVDAKVFNEKHVKLIKRAASFPEVERVLVHPAIKKALCQAAGTDRGWLGKVRPIQGHYYHFHIRISCPPGSVGCVPQKPTTGEDGCAKEVDEWLERLARAKLPAPPKPPGWKPGPPAPPISMVQLPADCRMVLESGPDGIPVPPEAMVAAAPVHRGKHAKKHEERDVVLRPVKERRQNREARAH
ncbi:MAG: penicillin-insensitive murein endopeptidase [Hyphomicrobium sp.]